MTIFHTARGGARPRWDQAINPSTAMARPQEIRSVGVTLSGSAGVPADWSTGEYAYDGAGNITAMGGETYTYDKVSRLVSSTRNGRENYTFDAFGNLTAMNGLLRTTDPATNRLTEAAYDRRGNLLAWGGQGFTWDTMGRMTSMQGPGINRSMFYDANGERLVVRDGTGYTFTLRDLGQQVLREVSWSSAAGWKWGKDYVCCRPCGTECFRLGAGHGADVRMYVGEPGDELGDRWRWIEARSIARSAGSREASSRITGRK